MTNTYKAQKEAFVSNLSGGSILEINLVTLVAPAAAFLYSALQSRRSFFTPYGPVQLLADFLLNVAAILFATTAYSSAPLLLNVLLIAPAVILLLLPPQQHEPSTKTSKQNGPSPSSATSLIAPPESNTTTSLPIRPFLTLYRGSMLIVTCTSILAVDFRIFPRRFAKVETWGTSLMDLGVGSFVFSAGLVSARAALKSRSSNSTQSFNSMLRSLRHSLPLLTLGLIRLATVKNLSYAEHVSEYGVHWNFFFTLSLLGPFVTLLAPLPLPYEATALALSVLYEIALNSTSLTAYILTAPRTDLLSQNREGVCSFVGYLAIFLAGRGTGVAVLAPPPSEQKKTKPAAKTKAASLQQQQQRRKEHLTLLSRLSLRALSYPTLYIASTHYRLGNLLVSRRMANLPYVLWVVGFNNAQVLLFALVDAVCFGGEAPQTEPAQGRSEIMAAFNSNGLAVFLIANLLTGAVNMGLDTLGTGALGAMGTLVAYAGCVTGFAIGMRWLGVKIKL